MMKLVKGLAVLIFFSICLGSCFDPPEFPNKPEIVFQDLRYIRTPDISVADTLTLTIGFKDGDGDLGIDPQDANYSTGDFRYADFFFANNNGTLSPLTYSLGTIREANNTTTQVEVFDISNPNAGKIAVFDLRKQPGLNTILPQQENCNFYEYRPFVIERINVNVLSKKAVFKDTLTNQNRVYYLVEDSLYLKYNPTHYNIEVEFWEKVDPNNPDPTKRYVEYDIREEYCATFDGRFPDLSDTQTALDGSLTYTMESTGFTFLGGRTFKLKVKIRDQALNESNVVETRDFSF